MNILHFADAHIGVTTHGKLDAESGLNDRVIDFLLAFDFIIDYAEEHEVDLVLFAGDMFHHNNPSPSLISEVSVRIKEISNICPIVLVPGNHDQAANRVSAIEFLYELDIPNVHISDSPKNYIFGDVFIGAMPYPTYSMFGINNRDSHAELELMEEVNDCMYRWLEIADSNLINLAILLMHGTIQGVKWGSYTGTALGHDSHMLLDDISFGWDYVALGHIHLHQNLTQDRLNKPPVVYAGSIERVDFGESVEPKGFVHITYDGTLTYEFIEIPARPMETVEIDIRDVSVRKQRQRIAKSVKKARLHPDALVRINVHADNHNVDTNYIKECCKVYRVVQLNVNTPRQERTRLEDTKLMVAEMDPVELVDVYLEMQDIDEEETDILLDMFEDILEDLDE